MLEDFKALEELRQIKSLIRRLGAFFVTVTVLFVIPACIFLILMLANFVNLAVELQKSGLLK